MSKEIKTPWGKIIPEVSLFPLYYLIFIYGLVYILPYGKFFVGVSWFDWLRSEDGPLEWMQFIEYAFSSLLALLVFFRAKKKIKQFYYLDFNSFFIIFNCWRRNKLGRKTNWGRN